MRECAARRDATGDPFGLEGFGLHGWRSLDSRLEDPAASGVCVPASKGWNAAQECGRGRRGAAGRGWPSLGVMAAASFVWCWEALWLTPGGRRVPGGRGPGKEDGIGVLFFLGSFRRPFHFSPGSAGSAGPAPRPGRLRFRSGKFCDAEDWGGVGAGRGGRNGPLGSGDRG